MATRAITPNPSTAGFPPQAPDAPSANERINVLVIGPEATPPESNAVGTNSLGAKKAKTIINILKIIKKD